MSDTVTITFECMECGGTVLELPDDYTDDSIASCKDCGYEFGPFRDVKAKALEATAAKITDQFKSAFKGLKGWTVK